MFKKTERSGAEDPLRSSVAMAEEALQGLGLAPPAPAPPPAPVPAPVPAEPAAPKAKISYPPPAAAPPAMSAPVRRNFKAEPQKATVTMAQGMSDAEKKTVTVPGGIPGPEYAVARSTLPKEDAFRDEKPLNFIRELVDIAPAGLLGSLVGDIQDLSYAYMDVNFLRELQAVDQKKKGLAQAAVAHAIGDSLQREIAAYQAEKYGPRGVACYKDMSWGLTANEFYLTTHAELLDGSNSRTGSWTAKWKINCQNVVGVNEATISGDVRARSWCYEDVTAHMYTTQEFLPVTLQGDQENPIARAIKNQIVAWEKEVMEALGAVYGDELDGTLKAIRRTLPITRTRLKWELIAERAIKKRDIKKYS